MQSVGPLQSQQIQDDSRVSVQSSVRPCNAHVHSSSTAAVPRALHVLATRQIHLHQVSTQVTKFVKSFEVNAKVSRTKFVYNRQVGYTAQPLRERFTDKCQVEAGGRLQGCVGTRLPCAPHPSELLWALETHSRLIYGPC